MDSDVDYAAVVKKVTCYITMRMKALAQWATAISLVFDRQHGVVYASLRKTHYLFGESRRFPYFANTPKPPNQVNTATPITYSNRLPQLEGFEGPASLCSSFPDYQCRCFWANTASGFQCYVKERISNRPRKQVHRVVDPIVRIAYDSRWERFQHRSPKFLESNYVPAAYPVMQSEYPDCRRLYHDPETAEWYCIPVKKGSADILENDFSVRTKAKKLQQFVHPNKDPAYQKWTSQIQELRTHGIV